MTPAAPENRGRPGVAGRLRRDLGTLESYAALIGILIGAGIFRVTSDAWALSGPSVILGYMVLAPAVLCTSVAYAVYGSTSLGKEPGGEYANMSRTLGGTGIAFIASWLKIIAYLGALAYLAEAFADYLVPLIGRPVGEGGKQVLALGTLGFFYAVHVFGVRWFGRLQTAMMALLGVSLFVLVVPGLFHLRLDNYRPFFTGGPAGFAACLPALFFAYAGFESLAQTAGEVKDSRRRIPRVFLLGTMATTVIFVLMSVVAFGVLPGERLATSTAPMSDVAAVYLPSAGAAVVTLGALMALATSINATMLVPSRLTLMLAQDGLVPRRLGRVSPRTSTPVLGLTMTFLIAAVLVLSKQLSLALTIAVFAMVIIYFLQSLTLLLLPSRNPELAAEVQVAIPTRVQKAAGGLSLLFMGTLIALQVTQDIGVLRRTSLLQRISEHSLTSLELAIVWSLAGFAILAITRRLSGAGRA